MNFLFCKKHLCLLCLAYCTTSVPNANLCWAGTDILQEKDEIQYVLPRDAIPAIKNPEFVPAEEAGLDDNEPVVGITINGESRAYSVYLLNHHEIVNDKLGIRLLPLPGARLRILLLYITGKLMVKNIHLGFPVSCLKIHW